MRLGKKQNLFSPQIEKKEFALYIYEYVCVWIHTLGKRKFV